MPGETTRLEFESQPEAWAGVLGRARAGSLDAPDLRGFDEVLVFGSGSSFYLATLMAELLEHEGGQPAVARPSCEVWLHPERYVSREKRLLGVAVSRSGESTEAVEAARVLRGLGVPVLAVGCTPGSSLDRLADARLLVPEGREDGLVMSRSFTSMLIAFQAALGLVGAEPDRLDRLVAAGRRLLAGGDELAALANARDFRRFVFLASGLNYGLAVESSLKMQEMAIVTSEAYHALEYRHGPKSTAGPDTLIVLIANDGHRLEQRRLLEDLRAYGVATLAIGEDPGDLAADLAVDLASGLPEAWRLALNLLPVHRLAFETALRLGRDPDLSQNLTQVVRLEPS